jgi:hypothetical protein
LATWIANISEVGQGPDRPDQLLMAARSPTVTLSSMKMPSIEEYHDRHRIGLGRN